MYRKMRYSVILLLAILNINCASPRKSAKDNVRVADSFYNVRNYGAAGDGTTIESTAINRAIEAASEAGGGTVYFPAGNYLTGSIRLKSNIRLFIDQGATIIAAPVSKENGYDDEEPGSNNQYQDYGHSHWHNSLIWGDGVHNVSIVGAGRIWGKGLYKVRVKSKQSANKSIALVRCRNVIIRDISILHGGWFCVLATGVDNFTLDNVKFDTNRDGVNVDCFRNVRISNCLMNTPYDDGICLKSSFALGYARATENVTITNCQLSGYEEGTVLDGTFKRTEDLKHKHRPTGRIKFGTESNGGFKNIAISNCVFDYCCGLALESVDGALLEDVTITNITMRDIVNDPIFLRLGSRMRGPAGAPVGQLHRINISNVIVYNAPPSHCSTISGIPGHYIEDIKLSNIHIYYKGGGSLPDSLQIPEKENQYPEPGMFGPLPAYGFFIRHTKNIKMNNIEISFLNEDARPPFFLEDVNGIYMHDITAQRKKDAGWFVLENVSDFNITQSRDINDQHIDFIERGIVK